MYNLNSSVNLFDRSQHNFNRMRRVSVGRRVTMYFCIFSLFFMISFPKGGLKVNDIPITIGYLLTAPLFIFSLTSLPKSKVSLQRGMCIFSCILLFAWSALSYWRLGGQSNSFAIAYFVSILYIPIFCLIFFGEIIFGRWRIQFEKCFKYAVRFVVTYAVFLFIYKYMTGAWIEIPYLTVNAADVGQLDEKHINRGGIFKAISTYNNGNILGVCLVILAPLYNRLENRTFFKLVFALALILTLSRTAWIGMLLAIIFIAISNGFNFVKVFYVAMSALFVGLATYGTVILLGYDSSFLVDGNLGGRLGQLDYLSNAGLIPSKPGIDLPEIVYIGVVHNYGYFGLILFVLALSSPIWAMKSLGTKIFSARLSSACMQGLAIYLIIAMSDAAFNYIPTMFIFWMIGAWGIWYAEPSVTDASNTIGK